MDLANLNSSLDAACLDFVADAPMIYHCHHFNLFLDQTVDDALGPDLGGRVRHDASRAAARQLITSVCERLGADTPAERLEVAGELFGTFGHGRLNVSADGHGGSAEGGHLHYGFAWREKYGQKVRRTTPADAVASGWAAAAVEVALRTDEMFRVQEENCLAKRDSNCTFGILPDPEARKIPIVTRETTTHGTIVKGIAEDRISAINSGLRGFLAGVAGDQRGLVEAFGVFVTRQSPNYYNEISYRSVAEVADRDPVLVPAAEGLLRESGHVCVFNTIGGILYSPEWDGMVGRVQGELEEVVSSSMAIARALGFGAWAIEELDEDHLVLATGSEYESPFCALSTTRPRAGNSYFLQGAGVAIMRLWEAIDWQNRPALDQELYNSLFRSGTQWVSAQTHSLAAGDPVCRVVVTRA